jgi:hypothetical protein
MSDVLGPALLAVASNDRNGFVLVRLTVFFGLLGLKLSQDGLSASAAAKAITDVVQKTASVAANAQLVMADAQQTVTESTGSDAEKVAASTQLVAASTAGIPDAAAPGS